MASTTSPEKVSVMFVCLGNICRSPLAGALFQDLVARNGLKGHFSRIESAGTAGYHIGEEPDERTVAILRAHMVPISSLAQQVQVRHFDEFDYLLAMDRQNLGNLERMKPKGSRAVVKLFGEYGDGKVVPDPYYGGPDGFERAYQQCLRYSHGFLRSLGLEPLENKPKV